MTTMKRTIYLLAILGLILGACDKIDEPYLEETGGSPPPPEEKVRKVLLEEFTGHLCVNCPEATKLANDLKQVYGEQVVLIAIHSGDLSIPSDPPFDADFRTQVGTDIFNQYQPIGVPTGLVNRTNFDGNTVLFKDSWEPAIQELLAIPASAHIGIELEYNAGTRELDLHLHTEFLENLTARCNLSVLIIENGIISPQKNDLASLGPTPNWLDYEHQHMLRGAVNGSWGELLVENPLAGDVMTKDLTVMIDTELDDQNVAVVAILLDADTHEIYQVEEAHIN